MASKSIHISDEGSNRLHIASHLTHFMPIQSKLYPFKGCTTGGWLRVWL